MSAFLPDQTRISQVRLRTANLQRALAFYVEVLGMKVCERTGLQIILSAAEEGPGLILLNEVLEAAPRPPRSAGLDHFAIRLPQRQDLAHAYRRLVKSDYPVGSGSDHGVSEAIYLNDPDGNGVELYADRPRSQWTWHSGQIAMTTKPLDLDAVLASIKGQPERADPPPQTDLGHIHLQVTDLAAAKRFYGEYLGLAVTQGSHAGSLFFSAGGYHHHIGVNTRAGEPRPSVKSVGLISYRLEVPVAEVLYCLRHRAPLLGYETKIEPPETKPLLLRIRDPNGNWLEIHSWSREPSPTSLPAHLRDRQNAFRLE